MLTQPLGAVGAVELDTGALGGSGLQGIGEKRLGLDSMPAESRAPRQSQGKSKIRASKIQS